MNSNVDNMTTLWTVLQDAKYTKYVHEYVPCLKIRLQQQGLSGLRSSERKVHRLRQFSHNLDQALW